MTLRTEVLAPLPEEGHVSIGSIVYSLYYKSERQLYCILGRRFEDTQYLAWEGSLEECRMWLSTCKSLWT